MEEDWRECPECDCEVLREDMRWTLDCHGIAYRLLCMDCWREAMAKGYDGEEYDGYDECLDYPDGW